MLLVASILSKVFTGRVPFAAVVISPAITAVEVGVACHLSKQDNLMFYALSVHPCVVDATSIDRELATLGRSFITTKERLEVIFCFSPLSMVLIVDSCLVDGPLEPFRGQASLIHIEVRTFDLFIAVIRRVLRLI